MIGLKRDPFDVSRIIFPSRLNAPLCISVHNEIEHPRGGSVSGSVREVKGNEM